MPTKNKLVHIILIFIFGEVETLKVRRIKKEGIFEHIKCEIMCPELSGHKNNMGYFVGRNAGNKITSRMV